MILLQTVADSVTTTSGSDSGLSILDLAIKGGWMMIPIAILGFIGLYVFIERLLTIRKAGRIDRNFMNQIRDMVTHGNIEAVLMLCRNTDTPVARMMEK